MTIKAKCGSCNKGFLAKDSLAGREVKCPSCKKPLKIPGKQPSPARSVIAASRPQAHNPLLDLLDEAGVEAMPRGPVCENCGAEVGPNAVICVSCGYNLATGQRLETAVFDDPGAAEVVGMTDVEKIMARAEKDIEDMPVSAYGQNFGDGADSILIAVVSLVFLAILVSIGVGTIFVMDQLGTVVDSSVISFFASTALAIGCAIWITIVAFMTKPTQGMICLATAGLYCVIFGFMQGRALIVPTIILLVALLIGFASSFFAFKEDGPLGMLFLLQFIG